MTSTILLLLLCAISVVTAQQSNFNLSRCSSLSPTGNSSLLSQSRLFAFGFFPFGDGFAVGIWFEKTPQKTVVWTANRNYPPLSRNATIVLSSDGRLISLEFGGQERSIATSTEPALSASLLDSGNFVLYNSDSELIWQSFDFPTDTLLPGQLLRAGNELVSSYSETNHSMGIFRIVMQNDGNVVMYPVGSGDPYWAAQTNVVGRNASMTLDESGRLHVVNQKGIKAMTIFDAVTKSYLKTFRATIDADGIFRLYSQSHDWNDAAIWWVEWATPGDACGPKGICGINGYCAIKNLQHVCVCPSGFVFINPKQTDLGCRRTFTAESCYFKNDQTTYIIQEIENTTLEDSTYALLSPVTKEECEQACLEDCNCEAASYKGQECSKQKLPLTFWRSAQVDGASTSTFVKVGINLGGKGSAPLPLGFKQSKEVVRVDILIIGIACLAFSFVMLAFSAFIIRYSMSAHYNRSHEPNARLIEDVPLRAFTYGELEVATGGFLEELGRGSFGTVFKGILSDGEKPIAVKRLDQRLAADQGEEEFRNEMRSIGRIHHRNLVRLLGYCHEGSDRLLVFEYMSKGTLADYLLKSEIKPNWGERIKIALNIARGIRYLHEECESRIIHCDINPNNILMDEYGSPKISDFGLAKLLMSDHSRTVTGIRGTRGYVAPEWHKNLPITVKADVYSFGIVFLVIVCCRRSTDINAPEDEAILAEWVYNCFKANEVLKLVPEEVEEQTLERMIKIGLWCIEEEPAVRPSMKEVVQMLECTTDIPVPPCAARS